MHRLRSFFVATILALASPGFAVDNQQPKAPSNQQQVAPSQTIQPPPAGKKIKPKTARPGSPSVPTGTTQDLSRRQAAARRDASPPSSKNKEKANDAVLKKSSKGVARKPKAPERPGVSGQRGPGTTGRVPGVDQQPAIQEGIDAAQAADAANKTRLRGGKTDKLGGGTSRFDPSDPDSQAFQRPRGLGGRIPDDTERERSRHWGIKGAPDGGRRGPPEGIGWATHMWERGPDRANSEPQSIAWEPYDGGIRTTQKFRTSDGWAFRRDETADDGSGSSTSIEYHRGSDGAQTDTYLETRDEQGRVTMEMFGLANGKWVATFYDYDKTGQRYVVDTQSGGRDEPDPIKDPAPDGTSGNYPNPLPWWHSRSMWSLSQQNPYERMGDPLSDRDDGRGDRGEGGTSSSGGSSIGSKLGWITDPVPFESWPGGDGGGYHDPGPGGDPSGPEETPGVPPQPDR